MYDEEAGSVDTAGIEEPDHVVVQPPGVVTRKESQQPSVENEVNVSTTARGEPVTDTVSTQLALFEYDEDAVTARERAPEYVAVELEPHT
jgi:hypothetical protein